MWEESEKLALNFIRQKDSEAKLCGGNNSYNSDIFSPKYGWIEVKDITNGARCGQFTESTILNNPYSKLIISNNYTDEDIVNFTKEHYRKKEVSYFLVVSKGVVEFLSFDDFFHKFSFSLQKPYKKRSGTSKVPKKDYDLLLNYDNSFQFMNDTICCVDCERWKTYFTLNENEYFINKSGVVRKRSKTNNLTWHILVEEK